MEQAELELLQPPPKDEVPRRYKDAGAVVDDNGYVWEWCPTHPKAKQGTVLQHRLVMECFLGRFLEKTERVHHKDHNRTNNAVENLELFSSQAAHMREHWETKGRRDPAIIEKVRAIAGNPEIPAASLGFGGTTLAQILEENPDIVWRHRKNYTAAELTEERVREALLGRTVVEAAALLKVHPQTLYNRFDSLLSKRSSPGALDQYKEQILRQVYKEYRGKAEIAAEFGVSRQCVIRSIQRWRREGAIPAGFEKQALGRLPPGPKPGRKWLGKEPLFQEHVLALGESLLESLLQPAQ